MRTMIGDPCLHYDCLNRNSFGYCKTTVCINEHYRQEQWQSTSNQTDSIVVKPMTNADRIRSMTDEEMADEILELFAAFYEVEWSKETLLNLLKQEAE